MYASMSSLVDAGGALVQSASVAMLSDVYINRFLLSIIHLWEVLDIDIQYMKVKSSYMQSISIFWLRWTGPDSKVLVYCCMLNDLPRMTQMLVGSPHGHVPLLYRE